MGLLLSAIEAFKKAELRDGEALAVDSPSVTPCDSDDDDSYSGFESTSDDEDWSQLCRPHIVIYPYAWPIYHAS